MSSDLTSVTKAFRRAEAQAEQRRAQLHAAIAEAVAGGMSKSEAARRTGYTREYVATIVEKQRAEQ